MPDRRPTQEHATGTTVGLAAVAVLGDLVAFLLFAGLGRAQHAQSGGFGQIVLTGAPFFLAWLLIATVRGMYRVMPAAKLLRVVRSVGWTWLLAWPLALAIRAGLQHRGIPLTFDIVALIANGVFVTGWRLCLQIVVRYSSGRLL